MQLIFFRHGPAEPRKEGRDDAFRPLTSTGRKKTHTASVGLRQFLISQGISISSENLRIWSSPLVRSVETAEIIGKSLQLPYQIQPFLAGDELALLLEAIDNEIAKSHKQIQAHKQTVIVVGHQPDLGNWCEMLTGFNLPLKKCAVAGLLLNMEQPHASQLSFFMQPAVLRRFAT